MGRLRRFLPRKADLSQVSGAQLAKLIQADSNTPRKCLGYFTPGGIYSNHLLRLKCESTFPRKRE